MIAKTTYEEVFFSNYKTKSKFITQTGREWNGKWYDCTAEARLAEEYDYRIDQGEVIKVERQVKLKLIVNGTFICNYYIDFKPHFVGGDIFYVEHKGPQTEIWRLKWLLTLALWPNIEGVEERAKLLIVK